MFKFTTTQAWRAFWANVGKASCRKFDVQLRLRMIERLVFPIINFRLSRWPFTHTYANRLDRIQRKMVSIVLHLRMMSGDTPGAFARRKQRLVSSCIPLPKRWSHIWATRMVSWDKHVLRNSHGNVWTARIASYMNAAELEARRAASASGRPDTRVAPGFTSARWYEAVGVARNFLDSVS